MRKNLPTLFPGDPVITFAALTLSQPWASAVVRGIKLWETRSRPTDHRGPLFIHAAAGIKKEDRYRFAHYLGNMPPTYPQTQEYIYPLPMGAIIGIVRVLDCKPSEIVADQLQGAHDFQELIFGDYNPGRFAYQMTDFLEFATPVTYTGALPIWDPLRARRNPVDILNLSLQLASVIPLLADPGHDYFKVVKGLDHAYEELRKDPNKFPYYKNIKMQL